jgi:hypothetical protein
MKSFVLLLLMNKNGLLRKLKSLKSVAETLTEQKLETSSQIRQAEKILTKVYPKDENWSVC